MFLRFTALGGWEPQDQMDVAAVDADFPREVLETFLRCKQFGFSQKNAVIELNGVKIAEDRTFADVARYVFTTILGALAAQELDVSRPLSQLTVGDFSI